jgi:hypothetical protein
MLKWFVALVILFCSAFSVVVFKAAYELITIVDTAFEKTVAVCVIASWSALMIGVWYMVIKIIIDEQV